MNFICVHLCVLPRIRKERGIRKEFGLHDCITKGGATNLKVGGGCYMTV